MISLFSLNFSDFPLGVWSAAVLHQLQALCVETVPLSTRHGLQQSLFLLGAARRFQLVHGGQVEKDALVEIERRVLLDQAFQLTQGLLQAAQIEQTHSSVVVGLGIKRFKKTRSEIREEEERMDPGLYAFVIYLPQGFLGQFSRPQ